MTSVINHLRRALFRPAVAFALLVALTGLSLPTRAEAFERLIRNLIADDTVPSCTQGAVLDTIRSKFDTAAARVLHANIALGPVDRITQDYAGQNDPSPMARRYCVARATLSDGRRTTLYYLVEQDAGFVGVTWNVEYCLAGYEPWHLHDGRCHTVRHRWW